MVGNLARNKGAGRLFHRRKPLYTQSTMPIPLFPKNGRMQFVFGPLQMEGIFYTSPHNRNLLSNGRIPAIEAAVRKNASKNLHFHSFAHSQNIVRVALEIASDFEADQEICYAAALMRDINRRGSGKGHEYRSANAAKAILEGLRLPPSFVQRVTEAILYSHKVVPRAFRSNEALVIWEASKIFNMGAYGFESRLSPICRAKNPLDNAAAYADAARTYLALEPQFRTPMFVEEMRISSESMHATFGDAAAENSGLRKAPCSYGA